MVGRDVMATFLSPFSDYRDHERKLLADDPSVTLTLTAILCHFFPSSLIRAS